MTDSLSLLFNSKSEFIDEWINCKSTELVLPFYSSADIRDSGFKASCIDLNLFPAGFNNLCSNFAVRAADSVKEVVPKYLKGKPFKNVLIFPEAHSRNTFYNENLLSLKNVLINSGLNVEIAAIGEMDDSEPCELVTASHKKIQLCKIKRENNRIIGENGEEFDWILLNNDLADGNVEWLKNIEQPILPPPCFGWHSRKKSQFFNCYETVIKEFADEFKIDPWLLYATTDVVPEVDFKTETGRKDVAEIVDKMLSTTREKFEKYNIDEQPYVFIKHDSGTYGMGIMVVNSSDQVLEMNRKARNKMAVGKGSIPIKSVVIQEAVPTRHVTENYVSESVIYLVENKVIGSFLRINSEKGVVDNLNARGMSFHQHCELQPVENPQECNCTNESQMLYWTLAKLAVIAAGHEFCDAHEILDKQLVLGSMDILGGVDSIISEN